MAFWTLLACAIGMTLAQDVFPARAVYHDGWYNAVLVACAVVALVIGRRMPAASRLCAGGAALVALAGAASGLLGPDTQVVAGAPGSTIETKEYGTLRFPLDANAIPQRSYTLSAVRSALARDVVHVWAADARGNHLTVTQPSNAAFLSPVLLMQQSVRLAGMGVRTDEFSLPAVSRSVKAVLFEPAQAAQMRTAASFPGKAAVLFAVSDANGQTLHNGLGLVPSGGRKRIAGLLLGADVQAYPALSCASAPYLPLMFLGLIVFAVGVIKPGRLGPGGDASAQERKPG
ncbi:MAG: hypothetical protein ABR508_11995 [Candidatus Baltobacteraceae bacterium]